MMVKGPVDANHANPEVGLGSNMCIDATRKWKEEGYTRDWPKEAPMSGKVKKRWIKF